MNIKIEDKNRRKNKKIRIIKDMKRYGIKDYSLIKMRPLTGGSVIVTNL